MSRSPYYLSITTIKLQAFKMKHQRHPIKTVNIQTSARMPDNPHHRFFWNHALQSCPRLGPQTNKLIKHHSPHFGSLDMLQSILAKSLLLLSLSMVSRLSSSLVKNKKKNWKEENPTMLSALTISFSDNNSLGHSWVGHNYAAMVFKLSHTVPSNLHFTHRTKSIVSVNMHQHSCGLTSGITSTGRAAISKHISWPVLPT